MANPIKIIRGVSKAVSKASEKKATTRGLKAAKGPSKAPKGYTADTTGRKAVRAEVAKDPTWRTRAVRYSEASKLVSKKRSTNKSSWEMMDKQINALRRSDAAMKKIIKKKAK